MGRGKHQITKDKKEIKQLAKIAAATRRAEKILERKDLEKDLPVWIRDLLGKILEKIDPMEFIATIAIMPLVKAAIDKSPDVLSLYQDLLMIGSPILGWLFKQILKPDELPKLDETMSWLISFGLAFIIVRNFGEILATGKSIGGWIAALFAG